MSWLAPEAADNSPGREPWDEGADWPRRIESSVTFARRAPSFNALGLHPGLVISPLSGERFARERGCYRLAFVTVFDCVGSRFSEVCYAPGVPADFRGSESLNGAEVQVWLLGE
jgi:hypothetical protein